MDTVEERAKTQLMVIEMSYNIKIQNKEEIARFIAAKAKNNREVLMISSAISSWIARNGISKETVLPIDMVMQSIKAVNDIDRS